MRKNKKKYDKTLVALISQTMEKVEVKLETSNA
jgi:hypothetical protein